MPTLDILGKAAIFVLNIGVGTVLEEHLYQDSLMVFDPVVKGSLPEYALVFEVSTEDISGPVPLAGENVAYHRMVDVFERWLDIMKRIVLCGPRADVLGGSVSCRIVKRICFFVIFIIWVDVVKENLVPNLEC